MKKIFLVFFLIPLFTNAQDRMLVAEGVSPDLYINHTVAAKENYYSIGRIYNVSPKDIAPYNKLSLESGLNLEQNLKIPLNNTNFFQDGKADADETFVPVYYSVKEKEGLYRVAVNHNNLPLETLKKWNNITDDVISVGAKLIVGYLKVKKDQSYLAKDGIGTKINANAGTTVRTEEKKAVEPEKKITVPTVAKANEKDIEKKETVKPIAKDEGIAKTVKEAAVENMSTTKKTETGPVKEVVVPGMKTANTKTEGGAFKNTYEFQTINTEVVETEASAGVFKSTSGWTDKKYYCLYNHASQGTIIKVTNPLNDKFVYAKVLDLIPDIKQNNGLSLIISNAAADELGVVESIFDCRLKFSK